MTPHVLPVNNYVNPYLQAWLPMSMGDRALFPALLSSSLSHQRINDLLTGRAFPTPNKNAESILQACYKETIGAINDALRDPRRATTDATILAVLMTVEKPVFESSREWSQESPFLASLQSLQWLSVHSAREPEIAHQDGLCKIIHLRGGLASIETPGVAAAAFYRVLVNATLSISFPSLPFFSLSGKDKQAIKEVNTNDPTSADSRRDFLHEAGLIPAVASVFQELADYTISIESYTRGDSLRLDAQTMCDRRNLVQYNLMSIPPISGSRLEDAVSEICRIGVIIYSIGVTFPLAGVGAPFGILVRLLKAELQKSKVLEIDPLPPATSHLLLWALTMGGIAALDKPERPYLTTALFNVISRFKLTQWKDMKVQYGEKEEAGLFDAAETLRSMQAEEGSM
ncbi:hypothetical protein N7448_003806 [Penicillium atrosanguineum]|uniref:Uncharacterized protein n=1 Tax=Penicillium atrosanguineum TaxID=1132637 RepID=A0A9W9L6C2_9EURO|nr:hypothetical protein N7448_003806 [Penicillium atrosanguineum]KAJ5315830.1 hypothetical protein N7476_006137 [Penicillium atrosanguineum]